jgi:hypothetical protein
LYFGRIFGGKPPKTGLFAPIFWLRQKDFRFNPLRRKIRETTDQPDRHGFFDRNALSFVRVCP